MVSNALKIAVGTDVQDVQWPQVVVAHRRPYTLDSQALAVVHIALSRVVAQYTADDDRLFAFIEPSIRPKPRPRLCG